MADPSKKLPSAPPENKAVKQNKTPIWPGLLLALALAPVLAYFLYRLHRLQFFPGPVLWVLGLLFFLLLLVIYLLARNYRKSGRTVLAMFLALLLGSVATVGSAFTVRLGNFFSGIFQPELTQTVTLGLYVRADDPAQSPGDLKGEAFGLLKEADRKEAEDVLKGLVRQHGFTPTIQEFDSPAGLIAALCGGSSRVILIGDFYLEAMEDLVTVPLRALDMYSVKIQVAAAPDKGEHSPDDPAEAADPGQDLRPQGSVLKAGGQAFAVYISGIDSRRGLVSRSLSDVNIIAVINPTTRQAALISTPRDYYINTPISGSAKDKLTHAGLYGVDVSRQTMESLYEMEIDYVFRLDFTGFMRIVDALGGIDVESDADFYAEGYHFVKGTNHLDGAAALAFVRERKAFGGSNQSRDSHQMAVIQAVFKKLLSPQMLVRFNEILDALEGAFESTIPYELMASLVRQELAGGKDWNLINYPVTGQDVNGYTSFSHPSPDWVTLPDEASIRAAKQLMWEVYYKETATAP